VTKRAMSRMLPQENNLCHYLNPKIGPPGREKWNQTIRNAALIRYYDILEEAASKAGGTDHPPYAMIKPDMGTEMESIISRANRLSQAEFSMIHKIRAGAMGLTADTAVRSGASGSDKKLCNRCPLGVADTVAHAITCAGNAHLWHAGFPDLPERGDPGYTKWTVCGTNEVKRLAFVLEGINPQMTKKQS